MNYSSNNNVFNRLFEIAKLTPKVSNARVAAAITRRNRIIAVGTNSCKSHPMQAKYANKDSKIYPHAEIEAIKNALKTVSVDDLTKCSIVIVRAKQDHEHTWGYGLAKPCTGCMRAIQQFGLRNITWSEETCLT